MDNGWVKLHRKMLKSDGLWGSQLTFGVFCYILLKVDRRTGRAIIGRKAIAKRFRAKESTIYKTLKRLQSNNQVTLQSNNQYTVVYVLNWRKYQVMEKESNTQSNNQVTHYKKKKYYIQEYNNSSANKNSISDLVEKRVKKATTANKNQRWQDVALEIVNGLGEGDSKRSSIFKCCKTDLRSAEIAFNDCKELGKTNVKYFLKVWNELTKKQ